MLSFLRREKAGVTVGPDYAAEIRERGFAVLRGVFPTDDIAAIRNAAAAFYDVAEREGPTATFPRAYLYNPGNMAVSMSALDDHGTRDYQLLRMVGASPVAGYLRHFLGDDSVCSLTHSRMRKSYPQSDPSKPRPSTVAWHKDGGDDVGYYSAYILWVPFTPCNRDYAGLEFQSADGKTISIDLEPGDAFLFSDTMPHRTADCPTSTQSRYSCDMRFFRFADLPARVHQKIAQEPVLKLSSFAATPW